MMSTRTMIVVMVGVVAGIGAFLATAGPQAGAPQTTDAVGQWLNLTAQQKQAIAAADPDFDAQSAKLNEKLADARKALAASLEDAKATDPQIMQQVEQVIAAHDELERRVAKHVLAIRSHLSAEQQQRLMGLCAQGVREAEGKQWRHGRTGDATNAGRGNGGNGGGGNRWGRRAGQNDSP